MGYHERFRRWLRNAPLTPARRRRAMVGPPELWDLKRAFQIRFLRDHGLEPGHRLLDLGCGTLRGACP